MNLSRDIYSTIEKAVIANLAVKSWFNLSWNPFYLDQYIKVFGFREDGYTWLLVQDVDGWSLMWTQSSWKWKLMTKDQNLLSPLVIEVLNTMVAPSTRCVTTKS